MKKLLIVPIVAVIICGLWIAPMVSSQPEGEMITLTIPGAAQLQLKMKLIPSGTFTIGSPGGETDRYRDEGPQYKVTISKSFYIGIYEVTQALWGAVMGTNPSVFTNLPNNPVESISWDDCQEFIRKLNAMGIGTFRLPTEAEWEYACRAGSTTKFYWGEDPGYTLIGQYAWYVDNSKNKTQAVGLKKPNAWGLFDMLGNIREWCNDWYAEPYSTVAQIDPTGPSTGTYRVLRGGSWNAYPQNCRVADRGGAEPTALGISDGFRLVRNVP